MSDLSILKGEIKRLGFVSGEKISLLAHFTEHVEKIAVAVSFLDEFDTDEDKRTYLRSLISRPAQPVAVQQSLPLQYEDVEVAVDAGVVDAEVVDAEVVVKPSVANEPSLSTSKNTYLPENASQLLRYYELWNRPYDKWPSLSEYSEYLHDVKKDRVHGSFKKEIEVLKKILSKDNLAQLRLAHLEGQLKMRQAPRNMKKIRRRKVSQLAKLFAKKDVIKEEVEIAQDAIVLGGYRRISQHYNDFHEASAQLVKRHLSDGNDEDLKDKEVVGKSPITKKMKRVIMN